MSTNVTITLSVKAARKIMQNPDAFVKFLMRHGVPVESVEYASPACSKCGERGFIETDKGIFCATCFEKEQDERV